MATPIGLLAYLLPAFALVEAVALAAPPDAEVVDVVMVAGPPVGLAALIMSAGIDAGMKVGFLATSDGSVKFSMRALADTRVGLAVCHSFTHFV